MKIKPEKTKYGKVQTIVPRKKGVEYGEVVPPTVISGEVSEDDPKGDIEGETIPLQPIEGTIEETPTTPLESPTEPVESTLDGGETPGEQEEDIVEDKGESEEGDEDEKEEEQQDKEEEKELDEKLTKYLKLHLKLKALKTRLNSELYLLPGEEYHSLEMVATSAGNYVFSNTKFQQPVSRPGSHTFPVYLVTRLLPVFKTAEQVVAFYKLAEPVLEEYQALLLTEREKTYTYYATKDLEVLIGDSKLSKETEKLL